MVNNFPAWGGNAYTLAVMVAQKQKEDIAAQVESLGHQDVADAIRSQ